MKILISLSNEKINKSSATFGPLTVVANFANKNMYSCTWANKMKNSSTILTKLGFKSYSVVVTGPNLPESSQAFKDLTSAALGFFSNCSTVRLEDLNIVNGRKWAADWIKNVENVSTLNVRLDIRSRERDNLHIPVTVGTDVKRRGVLLSITEMSAKCRVMLLNADGSNGNVLELPKDQIWIE
jgi:hypothetical protein